MPLLLNRRAFFQAAAAAAAPSRGARWALLADTHIPVNATDQYRGFKPVENLRRVVPDVLEARPEGAIIDGDLARLEGLRGDYESFRDLIHPLHSAMPVALSLGNHDDRKNFFSVFQSGAEPVKDRHIAVLDKGPVRFIVLDSLLLPNQVPGLLGKAQRDWLESYLKKSAGRPSVIFVHHTLDDRDSSLLDTDRFLRIVTAARDVKAVFYGHSHEYRYDTLDGVHLVNIPAIGYNFRDSEPVGWVEAQIATDGGDFKLRAIGGNMAQNGAVKSLSWRG